YVESTITRSQTSDQHKHHINLSSPLCTSLPYLSLSLLYYLYNFCTIKVVMVVLVGQVSDSKEASCDQPSISPGQVLVRPHFPSEHARTPLLNPVGPGSYSDRRT